MKGWIGLGISMVRERERESIESCIVSLLKTSKDSGQLFPLGFRTSALPAPEASSSLKVERISCSSIFFNVQIFF